MPHTQENRLIGIETPLGKDILLLRGFSGQEGISRLSNFDLDLLSHDPDIKFEDIIGKRVTLRVTLGSEKKRYFNGFISRFSQTGSDRGLANYRATMVPWLWFLTRTSDCRIFQKKTIPDIIEQIFKDLGFTDYKLQLQGSFEPRDYCVQYRETDFNFVSRLMEQYGLFYFFEHEQDKHTLVIANDPSAHQPCPEQNAAKWVAQGSGALAEDVITSMQWEQTLRPGKYAVTDYNFETPDTSLHAEMKTVIEVGGNSKFEIYDFPGEYSKKNQGDTIAKIRMEEEEAQYLVVTGTSSCRAFTSGYRFDLKDYVRKDMNQAYVLTNMQHVATVGSTYTTATVGKDESAYSNSFTCIPHKVPFRPPQMTPKPIIQGTQTAVVTGKAGEEIWTDNYGRVKVQFHWDREGQFDEFSSPWIRVSQVHAGKGFGGVDIPRIGEEVIVGFLEGDADQPIIVGRVYNAKNMPPNGLPGAGMVSGLKSNSTPGGGGNNSIMMNDTKGNELYSMNAQFNCTENVGNDRTTTIKVNDSLTVNNNQTIGIAVDRKETVGGTETITVTGHRTETVNGGETVTVTGGRSHTVNGVETTTISLAEVHSVGAGRMHNVGAAEAITVGGAQMVNVGAAQMVNVGGLQSLNVGASKSTKAGGNISEKAGGNISETAAGKISNTAGGAMTLTATGDFAAKTSAKGSVDAASELVLKCGGASIVLKSGGEITIKGTDITINGSKIGVKGSGPVTLKGSKVTNN
ncbi:MAG TPA: type VI secretion system tip protein TssI/VgrG [Nitrospira sp.]|nr:type VI secretion system tip protein TssI/VgrG [Nitrospira sp.]